MHPHPADRPVLSAVATIEPHRDADHPAVRAWAAHLDAGRLGAAPPPDPAVTVTLLATDALFRSFARRRPA